MLQPGMNGSSRAAGGLQPNRLNLLHPAKAEDARAQRHLKSMALSPISMPVRTVASSRSMIAPSS